MTVTVGGVSTRFIIDQLENILFYCENEDFDWAVDSEELRMCIESLYQEWLSPTTPPWY